MTQHSLLKLPVAGAPRPLTDFIGRTGEREDLACLLRTQRLVTVTGSGGAGKTRLVLVVAEELEVPRHWVTLASLEHGDLVAPSVARALGLSDADSVTSVDEVASALADDEVLLVLDTCEHVSDAVAEMVESLLTRCPGLSVVATSRGPLRIAGEFLWPIPPMGALSDPLASDPYPSDAVELFVNRARAVRPDLEPSPESITTIAAICSELDGNPLAIELAAARAQVLSIDEIHSALVDSLRLLTNPRRSAPQRHQTLRATLDWSHRLLPDEEAELFRRLAVFSGGATLEAVVAVSEGGLSTVTALDLLSALIDRSLLRVSLGPGPARYQLPEPVRQYAQERLSESGEETSCRDRHLSWLLAEVHAVDAVPSGAEQGAAQARLERELPNLRSAFAWARKRGDVQRALELATALSSFAMDHGHHREGRSWLDQALADAAGLGSPNQRFPQLWAPALKAAGVLTFLQCDYPAAAARLEAARAAFTELGDEYGAASAEQSICPVVREQGDYARAEELVTTSLAFWRSIGDDCAVMGALTRLAFTLLLRGDHVTAHTLATESINLARRFDDTAAAASALIVLGGAALAAGDLGAASGYLEQSHANAVEHQLVEEMAYAEQGLGLVALTRGDVSLAVRHLQASLRAQHELGDHWRTSSLLVELATCRRLRGEPRSAARLLGASEALLDQIGGLLPPVEWAERDRTVAHVSAHLSKDERDAAWMSGRSAPLATTVAAALAPWDDELTDFDAAEASFGPNILPVSRPTHRGDVPYGGVAPRRVPPVPASSAASATSGAARLTPALSSPMMAGAVGPPAKQRPVLTLQGLGREAVQLDGRRLSRSDFSYAKPRELLFFLADAGSADKSQIGLALWPEASPGELRSAFHTTLHHLRKAVGAGRVLFEHGSYRLDRDQLHYDVDAYTAALAAARQAPSRDEELKRLQRATELYTADFLATSRPDWSERTREELRERQQRALLALGRMLLTRGGYVAAVDAFRRIVDNDPLSESAHRELMRSYQAMGEPSRATRQYERLAVLLRDELGTTPATSTAELYQQIRAG